MSFLFYSHGLGAFFFFLSFVQCTVKVFVIFLSCVEKFFWQSSRCVGGELCDAFIVKVLCDAFIVPVQEDLKYVVMCKIKSAPKYEMSRDLAWLDCTHPLVCTGRWWWPPVLLLSVLPLLVHAWLLVGRCHSPGWKRKFTGLLFLSENFSPKPAAPAVLSQCTC